jgi:hypothetical protein
MLMHFATITLEKKKLGCFSPIVDGSYNGAFTLDIKLVLNENLGGILGGT